MDKKTRLASIAALAAVVQLAAVSASAQPAPGRNRSASSIGCFAAGRSSCQSAQIPRQGAPAMTCGLISKCTDAPPGKSARRISSR